jgi:adenylosuccinate synthase
VCTHYEDAKGNVISYQPGLHHIANVKPQYVTLPGWDGALCRRAKKMQDLPVNALKFLAFIEARTGFPIVLVTTGAKRDNIVSF